MKIGVKRGTVKIEPYSNSWKQVFEKERETLIPIFGAIALQIEHIGSTSIPNIIAKPLIDIAIQVANIDELKAISEQLTNIGYVERVGRLSGRQLVFAKGTDDNVTHHLHIIEQGEIDWDNKIKFKKILLTHPEIIEAYSNLKQDLKFKFNNNRSDYTKGKSAFILETLERYK